ncbi:MAG: TIGR03087 family PEP-CTERM/XrtA system glycosyltransferase [Acidobacteria bacterium]|nr:TIGR03087 family PEP-CTERM/XrtA system glycosyltransferase [Acidobacteriota bacterium]
MNVLFLTHRLPYAPNRGDRVRAHFLLRSLQTQADVDVVSLVHDDDEASHAGDLRSLASSVYVARVPRTRNLIRSVMALPGGQPTTHTMLDSADLIPSITTAIRRRRPDVVLAYCSGMARLALARPLRGLPFILDMVDVDSAKWAALAEVGRPPLSWVHRREARVLRRFEGHAAVHAAANLVVTARERDTLLQIAPDARVEVIPNGVDVDALQPRSVPADCSTVVFCGVMNYAPNEQAAVLLARDVWPKVRQRLPGAALKIVGANPTRMVTSLADGDQGIEVTGSVPDVRPHLWSAAVAAAPIVTARGIQNKVLEAVAAGLPTVVTPNIFDSLPDAVRPACVQASGASELAAAIVNLLSLSPVERRAMAGRADVSELTWDHALAAIGPLLRAAASGELTPPRRTH